MVALVRLAIPLIALRVGNNLMQVVDTIVAGRISPEAVAAVGLGGAAWFMIFIIPFGTLLGLDPLVSQAAGAGDRRTGVRGLSTARWLALALSVPTIGLVVAAPDILLRVGQPQEVVEVLRPYLYFIAAGVPPALLFHVSGTYLTAHGHTRQFLAITIALNVLNLALDIWFVHGGLGIPALGIAGIGAATAGCAFAEWVLISYVTRRSGPLGHLHVPWRRPDATAARRILAVGLPVGTQYGLEIWGFSISTFMMGLLGTSILAGHHIAISVGGLTFTMALGVSSAASARVGNAVGRGDRAGVVLAGRTALLTGLALGALAAAGLALFRTPIARLYTPDEATATWGATFLFVAAAFQFVDMVQAIGFGVLRGLGDTRIPMLFNVGAYYGLGLPVGAVAVFHLGLSPTWLWWGLSIALSFVAIALSLRFRVLSRRL